jgi:hypothetical protein
MCYLSSRDTSFKAINISNRKLKFKVRPNEIHIFNVGLVNININRLHVILCWVVLWLYWEIGTFSIEEVLYKNTVTFASAICAVSWKSEENLTPSEYTTVLFVSQLSLDFLHEADWFLRWTLTE